MTADRARLSKALRAVVAGAALIGAATAGAVVALAVVAPDETAPTPQNDASAVYVRAVKCHGVAAFFADPRRTPPDLEATAADWRRLRVEWEAVAQIAGTRLGRSALEVQAEMSRELTFYRFIDTAPRPIALDRFEVYECASPPAAR